MDTQRLMELIEDANLSAESYKGRGMIDRCVAIHASRLQPGKVLARLVHRCASVGEAATLVSSMLIDDPMLYWPNCSYIEDEGNDEAA